MDQPIERVVDLLPADANRLRGIELEEARARLFAGDPASAVRAIEGSFALVARQGIAVRLARSLDRPLRYFLAKRAAGPALFVADRIDTLREGLAREGLDGQFHPSYTRMVPAHHVVEIQLVGCPDPDPVYTRFFDPPRASGPADLDTLGARYVGALADELRGWLIDLERARPGEPLGVSFSGGVDSGAVFVVLHHVIQSLGLSPARLKAFVLDLGDAPDAAQARDCLRALGMELFLEPITATPAELDVEDAIRAIEDYKPLDVECAAVGLALCRGIRARYPGWRVLVDGDGGDENLKDYPIEDNPELTIKSVIDNRMLYHEGWGVGRIKHSLTYSGGLSRGYARTYAPARRYGFEGFSPYTSPRVVEAAEAIPFGALTRYDVPSLYSLKGELVRRGVRAVTGRDMPVFPKRRFQHGAVGAAERAALIAGSESAYRQSFLAAYA